MRFAACCYSELRTCSLQPCRRKRLRGGCAVVEAEEHGLQLAAKAPLANISGPFSTARPVDSTSAVAAN